MRGNIHLKTSSGQVFLHQQSIAPTDMSQSLNVSLNGGAYLMDQPYLLGRPMSTLEDCAKIKLTE